jgi:CHAT domain
MVGGIRAGMNKDFEMRIEPVAGAGNEAMVQLVVYGTDFPPYGRPLGIPRAFSVLPPLELEELLRGELATGENDAQALFEKITETVSQWLLDADLNPLLSQAFYTLKNEDKLRLIFSVDESLRSIFDITEVPVELVRPQGDILPYAVSPKCAAILHAQDKQSPGRTNFNWPLRVLFVRSNPKGLSDAVPEALPIVNYIVKELAGSLGGESAVQVDLLSSESPALPPPTMDSLSAQLRREDRKPYHILVYLGHCSLKEIGKKSVGYLQLESVDGEAHEDISPERFVTPLGNNPVPVVLLVGCMTAAKLPHLTDEKRKNIEGKIPGWIRGSQNVAQALISSVSTGVKVVVGMRYRLYSDDAETFLRSFFENLLGHERQKGDVEAAVHFARQNLQGSRYLGIYSAPVIFRAVGTQESNKTESDEPLFGFLNTPPPSPAVCDEPVGNWTPCAVCWDDLQSLSWSTRSQDSKSSLLKALEGLEAQFREEALGRAPFVMSERVVAEPNKQGFLQVSLYGSFEAKRLQGVLFPDSKDVIFTAANASLELTSRGFKFLSDVKSNEITFDIRSPKGENTILDEGPLFEVTMQLGPQSGLRYKISTGKIEASPPRTVCPGVNVVIVPPP